MRSNITWYSHNTAVPEVEHETDFRLTERYGRSLLQWRHNDHDGVWNHQPRGCLLNRLFSRRSKKTSKLRVTGLCARNSPVTGEFPAQMASNVENVSIWWRHHVYNVSVARVLKKSDRAITAPYCIFFMIYIFLIWRHYGLAGENSHDPTSGLQCSMLLEISRIPICQIPVTFQPTKQANSR